MTETGIPSCQRNYLKTSSRYLTIIVILSVIIVNSSVDFGCTATPFTGGEWSKEQDSIDADIHRRFSRDLRVAEPHEKCFDTECNRVTHYCDEVIRSCVSCEDDCHPGRIDDDGQAIQECRKKCDWFYYINSLKFNLHSTSQATASNIKRSDIGEAELTDYQLFIIILVVVIVCFTAIIVIIVGVFCYILKKSSPRPTGVNHEFADQSSSIYKPRNLRPYSLIESEKKQSRRNTNIKLLANCSEDSLNNRTVQQESFQNNSNNPSSIILSSNSQAHNCHNNACSRS